MNYAIIFISLWGGYEGGRHTELEHTTHHEKMKEIIHRLSSATGHMEAVKKMAQCPRAVSLAFLAKSYYYNHILPGGIKER
jgi:hypothetical protein